MKLYLSVLYSFRFDLHVYVPYVCVCACVCRCFLMLNSWVHVSTAQGSWKHITEIAEGRLYIPALKYTACSLMHMEFVH
jgi:hypothetical protein